MPVVELTNRLAVSVSGTSGPPCIIPYIAKAKVPKNKKQGNVNNWGKQMKNWKETKTKQTKTDKFTKALKMEQKQTEAS